MMVSATERTTDARRLLGWEPTSNSPASVFFDEHVLGCSLDQGRFSRTSRGYESLLGWRREALIREEFIRFVHPEDIPMVDARLRALAQGAASTSFVSRHRDSRGGYHWLAWVAAPGNAGEVDALARDVTAELRALDAVREQRTRLEQSQRLAALGVLSARVAHDVNNLLSAVSGNAELVLERGAPPSQEELLSIRDSARHAADLCRQLQTYAGDSSGRAQDLDLSALARSMAPLLAVASGGNRLDYELVSGLSAVTMHAVQMRQILLNLVANAADAIGARAGTIRIRTGLRSCQSGSLHADRSGGAPLPGEYVWVSVSDDGSGMDIETRDRLFDPSFSTKGSGRGLGLPIVIDIVRSYRGALLVSSEPGQGTTFEVLIPSSERCVASGIAFAHSPNRQAPLGSLNDLATSDVGPR